MGLDIIDFTDLQKRGLIKMPETKDTLDFTISSSEPVPITNPASSLPADNPFDMLSSLSQVSSASSISSGSAQIPPSHDISLKLDTIVNKLEDTLYKIESLSSRIAVLESRLSSLRV